MDSKERRKYIENLLMELDEPLKGQSLASELGVTRQIIVKDIAILRASGKNIIATPEGYMISKEKRKAVRRVIATLHRSEDIRDELECIVRYGGTIEDVIVEHPLYGEIKGMLMIRTFYDIDNFIKKINEYKAEPLLILTAGVHLHTIQAEDEFSMQKIIEELREKKYLVSDE